MLTVLAIGGLILFFGRPPDMVIGLCHQYEAAFVANTQVPVVQRSLVALALLGSVAVSPGIVEAKAFHAGSVKPKTEAKTGTTANEVASAGGKSWNAPKKCRPLDR